MRWEGIGLAVGIAAGITACGAHHLDGEDDAGRAVDAGTVEVVDGGVDAGARPDVGPPPDLEAGCTRSDDTVSGHAITPAGPIDGRQGWLWTFQGFGPTGPTQLVIDGTTALGPELGEGALGHGAPVSGQLAVHLGVAEGGARTATIQVANEEGEVLSAEGASVVFENEAFDGSEPVRGTLRFSAPGWDVFLTFDFPICGHLAGVCLC